MVNKDTVLELINEKLDENPEFYLVDLKINNANKIYIEIDHKQNPISINDCIGFSRQVEHNLDREEEDFELEVTSPGLSQPFKVHHQYVKNLGKEVKVMLNSSKSVQGMLEEVNEEEVMISFETKEKIEGKKKKLKVQHEQRIKFEEIKETKIIVKFK
ncbi:ribosome assembly cofactor RimP [bacterium]|nr:ribosome assembly cofactor RimP [bacterium]MDB4089016.1 ribosome assembly cofactor RimP [Flavobacteriales bacterium]